MKKYFLLFLFLQCSFLFSNSLDEANKIVELILASIRERFPKKEGFKGATLIQQKNKVISVQDLQNNDCILGLYSETQKVIVNESIIVFLWYEISLENGLVIEVASAQKFYDAVDCLFKEAQNLQVNDYLGHHKILKVIKKEEFKEFYKLTTSDHIFLLDGGIIVHNADIAQVINRTIQVGSFILKHPVVAVIGRTVSLSKLAIFLYEIALDAQDRSDRLLQALEDEEIAIEIRNCYQARYKQLSDLLSEYQAIEQAIIALSMRSNISTALFSREQYKNCNDINLIPALSTELSYTLEQRKKLLELREKSLQDIEQKVIDIQISLILQLQTYYEQFNRNIEDLCLFYKETESYIQIIYETRASFTTDFAYKAMHKIISTQEILETLLQQIHSFKLLYQYYQQPKNANILKNSTNIIEIFLEIHNEIIDYETNFLALRSILTNMVYDAQSNFVSYCLLHQQTITAIVYNLQKERQKKNQQEDVSLLSKKSNIQFPETPEDPEDKDKQKKRKYTGVDYHNQNSRGSKVNGKSPDPRDGQKALDDSIPFKEKGNRNLERRLGKEGDHYVVFDEHNPGEFHGHLRTWDELEIDMQNTIRKSHLIKIKKKV